MESQKVLIILVLTSTILAFWWLKTKLNYWKKKGVTTLSHSILLRDMKEAIFQQTSMAERIAYSYRNLKTQGSKHGGIYFLWKPIYIAIDLDVVKSILQTDFQHFIGRGVYYDEKEDPLSAHLFSLRGKKWKIFRQTMAPFFSTGQMKIVFQTMVECADVLKKVLDREIDDAVDIRDILSRFSIDVIGICAFGMDCNSLENPNSEFIVNGKRFFHRNIYDNLIFLASVMAPKIAKIFRLKLIPNEVSEFFIRLISDHVSHREKNDIFRKDLMHLLIQVKNKGELVDDEKLSEEKITEEDKISLGNIAAQVFTVFEAGFETSSTASTFCLYELAKNKNIQEKLRKEIRKVLASHNNQLTYDAVMCMNYLEQAIKESLRKYPPAANLVRECTKEYQFPGSDLILDEGLQVMIPIYGIHHDPDFYPDPEKFDPDRFSEENKKIRPAFSFIPFGEGPRRCLGARFGMMQAKVGLISLLLNYEVSVNEKTKEPLQYDPRSFTLSTEGGMWLNLKKITKDPIE